MKLLSIIFDVSVWRGGCEELKDDFFRIRIHLHMRAGVSKYNRRNFFIVLLNLAVDLCTETICLKLKKVRIEGEIA